eukprot:6389319-Pyramimonas_sp.AAC.2
MGRAGAPGAGCVLHLLQLGHHVGHPANGPGVPGVGCQVGQGGEVVAGEVPTQFAVGRLPTRPGVVRPRAGAPLPPPSEP